MSGVGEKSVGPEMKDDAILIEDGTHSENPVEVTTGPLTGRHLRAARVFTGLTQAQLAAASGVYTNSVRYWERQNRIELPDEGAVAAVLATLLRSGIEMAVAEDGEPLIILRDVGV